MDQDLNRTRRRSRADPQDARLKARLERAQDGARLYLRPRLEVRSDDELWLLDGAEASKVAAVELSAYHGTDYFYPYFHRYVVELFQGGKTLLLRHEQIFDDTYSEPDSSLYYYRREGGEWIEVEAPDLAGFEQVDRKDCAGMWADCGCMACLWE